MPAPSVPTAPDLLATAGRIDAWRSARTTHRLPPWAWAAAVRLAERHGVSRTSQALRLDFYELRRRLAARVRTRRRARAVVAKFVEISPASAVPAVAGSLEIEDAGGRRMRVPLPGLGVEGVERLVRVFLERPA